MLMNLHTKIEKYAHELGFDLVGFTQAKINPIHAKAYKKWLKKGYAADMAYMKKPRHDLQKILTGAKSVIVLGINYYYPQASLKPGHGRIARYAYGRDYHKVIGKKLKQLEEFIKEITPNSKTKSYIDTGPILERTLAAQAGIGFIGKNSTLITREYGSWVFLAEILVDKKLKPPLPDSQESDTTQNSNFATHSLCGRCTKCIDTCPTGAIIAPGIIDARKCLSYLTIENKKECPGTIKNTISQSRNLFGCDICQEVCPHNITKQKPTTLSKKIAGDQLSLTQILEIKSDQEFLEKFAGSPLMRAKRKGLQRTAKSLT